MALFALLVGVLAVVCAAAPAAAAVVPRDEAWESWSTKAAVLAFSAPVERAASRRDVGCPVPITGYTGLAALIGIAPTQFVSPIANCIAQDGTALRPGKLVTSSQDEAEYCCVQTGTTQATDPAFCSTGCAGQVHSVDGFFFDSSTSSCYQRCFETATSLCADGSIVEPVPLGLDTASIAQSNPLLVNGGCPLNRQSRQNYLVGTPETDPRRTGYAISLDSDECDTGTPLSAVCRGKGTVATVLGKAVCQSNTCGVNYQTFVGLAVDPNTAPTDGTACYYDCFVEPTTCIGYSSDCLGYCSGQYAYAGVVTTAVGDAACASAVCWQGGFSSYNGYSLGNSGIIACPSQ